MVGLEKHLESFFLYYEKYVGQVEKCNETCHGASLSYQTIVRLSFQGMGTNHANILYQLVSRCETNIITHQTLV